MDSKSSTNLSAPIDIFQALGAARPGKTYVHHQTGPHLDKATWEQVGNQVTRVEKTAVNADNKDYITLRLDIRAMGTLRDNLIKQEVFTDTAIGITRLSLLGFSIPLRFTVTNIVNMLCGMSFLIWFAASQITLTGLLAILTLLAIAHDVLFLTLIKAPQRRLLPVQKGFSPGIAWMMTTITHTLATELQAELAFTQSDELTILIPPTFKTKGSNVIFNPHAHSGRHDKLITLASSRASELARQIIDRKIMSKFFFTRFSNRFLSDNNFSVQFDARMGVWQSKKDAMQLFLWRAYDCSVNGVSDAIHCFNPKLSCMGTVDKLDWLNQQGILPLPAHQAYGTFFQRQNVARRAWNPKDRVWVNKQKSELIHAPHGNLVAQLLRHV